MLRAAARSRGGAVQSGDVVSDEARDELGRFAAKALTAAYARRLFEYNPETGDLIRRHVLREHCASDRSWRVRNARAGQRAGSILANGYRSVPIDGRRYYAHRLAWLIVTGEWPAADVDHRNGSRDDNRWLNLREATRAENHQNRIGHRATGTNWHIKSGRWRATICIGGKQRHLGLFDTQEDAAAAYREAKANLHTFQPNLRVEAA